MIMGILRISEIITAFVGGVSFGFVIFVIIGLVYVSKLNKAEKKATGK